MTDRALLALLLLTGLPAMADAQQGRVVSRRGDYPVTMREVDDADFASMRTKNAALEEETVRRLGVSPGAPGSSDRTFARENGDVVELVTRVVPIDLDAFLRRVQPELWGPNLADYVGGQVRALGGGRQLERMVLRAPLKNLDMTKVEEVARIRGPDGGVDRVVIYWEVLHSDNGSVVRDVGSIRFSREGDGTRITSHSAHRLGVFPFRSRWLPERFKRSLMGWQLERYFRKVGATYGEVANGKREAARASVGIVDALPR